MKARTLYNYILTIYSEIEEHHLENPYDDRITIIYGIIVDIKYELDEFGIDEIYCEDIMKILYDQYIHYWIKTQFEEVEESTFQTFAFVKQLLNLVHNVLTDHNLL